MFGASPDGLVEWKFCGLGCLEIKCPFILKNGNLCDMSRLTAVSGELRFVIVMLHNAVCLTDPDAFFFNIYWCARFDQIYGQRRYAI